MPQLFNYSYESGLEISIWEVSESPIFFLENLDTSRFDTNELRAIPHPQKQLEWLASRYLLQKTTSTFKHAGITKDEFGKPHLLDTNLKISLSHTQNLVAVALQPSLAVGLDIEIPSEKLRTVAHKFLNDSERTHANNRLEYLCVYWACKEAVYKYYGKKALSFKNHIAIKPFEILWF